MLQFGRVLRAYSLVTTWRHAKARIDQGYITKMDGADAMPSQPSPATAWTTCAMLSSRTSAKESCPASQNALSRAFQARTRVVLDDASLHIVEIGCHEPEAAADTGALEYLSECQHRAGRKRSSKGEPFSPT